MTRPAESRAERRRRLWLDACEWIVVVEIILIIATAIVLLVRAFASGMERVPWA